MSKILRILLVILIIMLSYGFITLAGTYYVLYAITFAFDVPMVRGTTVIIVWVAVMWAWLYVMATMAELKEEKDDKDSTDGG